MKIAACVVGRFLLSRNKRLFPLWLQRLVSFRLFSIQIDVSSVEKPEESVRLIESRSAVIFRDSVQIPRR